MFVLGNLLATLADLLNAGLNLYSLAVVARVLLSWVNPDPFNPIVQFLHQATDPYLDLFRRVIPTIGPIDISPIIALLVLQAAQHFMVRTLMDLSVRLR